MGSEHVVVIGDALIDEIRDERGVRELVGGAALNVAVGLRRLGIETTLVAMVGDDESGDRIRAYVADHGVNLIASPAPGGSSRATVTRSASGEPTYEFNAAAKGRMIAWDGRTADAIGAASVVVVSCFPFDSEHETEGLLAATEESRLIIDPNPRAGMMTDRGAFADGFERFVAFAELLKIGSDDAELVYGVSVAELTKRLRRIGAEAVLATAGADGATLVTEDLTVRVPISTPAGTIVDTVGAGDATLATVAAGLVERPLAEDSAWRELLVRAMDVAAATVRSEGGLLRVPPSDDAVPNGS